MPEVKDGIIDRKMQGEFVSSFIRQLKFHREDFKNIGYIGGFTSLIDMGNFALSFNNDGVGTKTMIAEQANKYDTLGIDCVAMNVNDAITVGSEPIAMVDYLAVRDLNEDIAKQLGNGFNVGAQIANISIVGGETAVVPEIVNHIDVSGAVIGIVQKNQIITGANIKEGDVIIGLGSSGLHSNGFTTVRKIISDNEINLFDNFPGESKKTYEVLLEPTRIYVREILDVMGIIQIKGMANITGGGFKNITRMKDMKYVIDDPMEPQNVFVRLMELGNLNYKQMYEIFNMGTGFVVVIGEDDKIDFINTLKNRVPLKVIGHVENGTGVEIPKYSVSLMGYY
ncbi:phosphoribosylformylglycinamide cyclo-ligase [Thermoplasma volcanium GSS1]|uniref:Phosphoribosylformylglycinamidine cyclo-ligase n=1 Tax=Thermoplasma volcanium (strain ATCC 51530 / DSM 4299 / JCM 9571 / NBRC 15438 / GSS1) TaxID=273116 RepID=PUR5_THEVO|nr:phosphoribosylformylglycinamidine cyclo-ligase [Thermoplasma volcanium]Q97CD7.1 RecName: Full=Phosphoribosylformylglycinamidine cyclo-ligase; AltName: Full=AIR synthase; AltName: Full=AIRS; AltName: Full=Phosphoribosyl-aminoimidazole synthetase [Thermoplasma volcanium GSS1]BAB59307.1 phosphoribosylformylglycinamide cyclo-ligase [Thermoplasma volcanium GSS1]